MEPSISMTFMYMCDQWACYSQEVQLIICFYIKYNQKFWMMYLCQAWICLI